MIQTVLHKHGALGRIGCSLCADAGTHAGRADAHLLNQRRTWPKVCAHIGVGIVVFSRHRCQLRRHSWHHFAGGQRNVDSLRPDGGTLWRSGPGRWLKAPRFLRKFCLEKLVRTGTCGLVAMTSASHAVGRQFDPGQVCCWTRWRLGNAKGALA